MIRLPERERRSIYEHGEATYPHECCGFLLGREENGAKVVLETLRALNTRDDSPHNRYLIQPEDYRRAEDEASRKGLDLVGCYHSHPDHPAAPSQFDRDHAMPWWSYLIVAVHKGRAIEMNAFSFDDPDGPFEPEPMEIEPR